MVDYRAEWEKLKQVEGSLKNIRGITPRNAGPVIAFFLHTRAMIYKIEHKMVFIEMLKNSQLPGLSEKRRRQHRKWAYRYARRAGLLREAKTGLFAGKAFSRKERI